MQHALSHLNVPVYKCLHCEKTTKSLFAISFHFYQHHRNQNMIKRQSYSDNRDDYHNDIMAILDRCYARNEVGKVVPSKVGGLAVSASEESTR